MGVSSNMELGVPVPHLVPLLIDHLKELVSECSIGPEAMLLLHSMSITSGNIIMNGSPEESGIPGVGDIGLLANISISTDTGGRGGLTWQAN